MKLQWYEEKNRAIKERFEQLKAEHPEKLKRRIDMSYCIGMFGAEAFEDSIERLSRLGYKYAELRGNYGGPDIGDQVYTKEYAKILDGYGVQCSGINAFFSQANALNSPDNFARQRAIEYIRAEVKFCSDLGGKFMLVTPSCMNMPAPFDCSDYERSVSTLRSVADVFVEYDIKCAIEPVMDPPNPLCHRVADGLKYIEDVNHPGVQHINGDVGHMMLGEDHMGEEILRIGSRMVNMHLRDTNSKAIGHGMLDVDTVIMALYLIGQNEEGRFVSGEINPAPEMQPLVAISSVHEKKKLDQIARDNLAYFREREEELITSRS